MSGDIPGGTDDTPAWLDREAGPMVRSFAVTGGRTRSNLATFDLVTYVVATDAAANISRALQPEHRSILARIGQPASIAEIASHLDLPVGVVRVLLGDLLELDAISIQEPRSTDNPLDDHVLKAVIHGLRSL